MLIDGGSTLIAGVVGSDPMFDVAKSGSSGKTIVGMAGVSGRLMVGTGGFEVSSTWI